MGRKRSDPVSLLSYRWVNSAKRYRNAHRIYTVDMIREYFEGFQLLKFSLIPDDNKDEIGIVENPAKEMLDKKVYACGCFLYTK